jgi:enoyl-CoA hydratase/carnithine racemase
MGVSLVGLDEKKGVFALVFRPTNGSTVTLTRSFLSDLNLAVDSLLLRPVPPQLVLVISLSEVGFCAGADVAELIEANRSGENASFEAARSCEAVVRRLSLLPSVAVIGKGACLGGGYEIALSCKGILCASDDALVGLPEVSGAYFAKSKIFLFLLSLH